MSHNETTRQVPGRRYTMTADVEVIRTDAAAGAVQIRVLGSARTAWVWDVTFTPPREPLPTGLGAVVEDPRGVKWVYDGKYWRRAQRTGSAVTTADLEQELLERGGFTVLSNGVES